jgi:iron(III) transport system substrate-binding protein
MSNPTRRRALTGAAALPIAGLLPRAAAAETRKATKVLDFSTAADVAKAEQEGTLVFYTHDGEAGAAAAVDGFTKDFPKIKAAYVRLQTGALFSRILAERSAGRFDADVIQFSDIGTAMEFQKKGGYETYESPEYAGYGKQYVADNQYFYAGMIFCGIAYNTDKVKPEDAPKTWKDILNPRWKNIVSCKQATSGMQFVQWYELRKLYGDSFWKEFGKQRPHGFDSRAQLFDRLSKGDDTVCLEAEYAAYLLYRERKAPIAFVAPEDGLPATAVAAGVVNKPPHPEAARLFIDWLASPRGQAVYRETPDLKYASIRDDAPPMADGSRLRDLKLLIPQDMADFLAQRKKFNADWNEMLGLL